MTKVGWFIDEMLCCKKDHEWSKAKWEVVDIFIIGFFGFMTFFIFTQLAEMSCIMNNYYSDGCHYFRDLVQWIS